MANNFSNAISCLLGEGRWYLCETGSRFVGCCRRQPCETGCQDEDLLPTIWDTSAGGSFPDLECDSGQFYTCTTTWPNPFLGCCKENPCRKDPSGGCPYGNLTAARLPDNRAKVEALLKFVADFQPRQFNHTSISKPAETPAEVSPASSYGVPPVVVVGMVALLLATIFAIASILPFLLQWKRNKLRESGENASER